MCRLTTRRAALEDDEAAPLVDDRRTLSRRESGVKDCATLDEYDAERQQFLDQNAGAPLPPKPAPSEAADEPLPYTPVVLLIFQVSRARIHTLMTSTVLPRLPQPALCIL